MPNLCSKNRNLVIVLENWTKSAIKRSIKVLPWFIKLISTYFVRDCGKNFTPSLTLNLLKVTLLAISSISKVFLRAFSVLNLIFRATEMWKMAIFDIFQEMLFLTLYERQILSLNHNRVVFNTRFNVFLRKQECFWSFLVFSKK